MSWTRLVCEGLLRHWRSHLALALGALVGAAVLTGALLVGDSVRGSLRRLALERLGRIDVAVTAPHFFRQELVDELVAHSEFKTEFFTAVPAILLQGTVIEPSTRTRAAQVTLVGASERWEALFIPESGVPMRLPAPGEIVLNEPLAAQLRTGDPPRPVQPGDAVVLRLPLSADIPADSPLGQKEQTTASSGRLRIAAIVPAQGFGRFGLSPNQQIPLVAFVHPRSLQRDLDEPDRVNTILIAGPDPYAPPAAETDELLQRLLQPRPEDLGLTVAQAGAGYTTLSSQRMLLSAEVLAAVQRSWERHTPQAALTYLANWIRTADGAAQTPYSTVAGLDFSRQAGLPPLIALDGQAVVELADDEILVNAWLADDFQSQGLALQPGDPIRLTYFEPEGTHGSYPEAEAELRVKAVVQLQGSGADRDLTPELQGVTDADSIADWDPPFEYDPQRVRTTPPNDIDERYWDAYRAAPKAIVTLATARRLWGSRFGETTSLRVAPAAGTAAALRAELNLSAAEGGFVVQAVKRQAFAAANGTTPFDLLFLGFSLFLMLAAVILIVLLFRLAVERRASQIGLLLALGFTQRQVRRVLLAEGVCVAAVGSALGVGLGLAYARLLVTGLRTWWVAAVGSPFLELHVTRRSLVGGAAGGVCVAAFAIYLALRQLRHSSARDLLHGKIAGERPSPARQRRAVWGAIACLAGAGLAAAVGSGQVQGELQAASFFGAGVLLLTACLLSLRAWLRSDRQQMLPAGRGWSLAGLALRNARRNPGRTALTVGLVAAATFLIAAIGAFHLDPPGYSDRRDTGTGGFALIAESAQPIHQDLNTPAGRRDLGISEADASELAQARVFALRLQPGDEASCLNLYQPRAPRIAGVPEALLQRGGFGWSSAARGTEPAARENPWLLLRSALGTDDAGRPIVPVVLDQNTALYSLHLAGVGSRLTLPDGRGKEFTLQVVGLLKTSILQGVLLIDEREFLRLFPDVSGYELFLVESGFNLQQVPAAAGRAPSDAELQQAWQAASDALESRLEGAGVLPDRGFDAEQADRRLAALQTIQNTYLATFQTLGGLGLLLGTLGLAVVQLRNVWERRSELAVLQTIGFQPAQLGRMVLWESVLLLLAGLAVGLAAAALAVLPHRGAQGSGTPWLQVLGTVGLVLVVGLLAGILAMRSAQRSPILAALRGE